MRIAVIGAGFFGHHITAQLTRVFRDVQVDMFDKECGAMLGAGTTNQCRLHQGFHYPRSGYTIYQSIMGYDRFVQEYGTYLHPVTDNLYAIHRDGLVTVDQYLAVMDSFHLDYELLAASRELFREPSSIDAVLRVREMSIDVRALREGLARTFTGTLHLATPIDEIDAVGGLLRSGRDEYGPYDYVINATYSQPNLGLPAELHFPLKWELAALVLAATSLAPDQAVTIMDGPFVSVYPAYDGLHTLSSVSYTPMRRYEDPEEVARDYPTRFALARDLRAQELIGQDVLEYIDLEYEPRELWVTVKTKLHTDMGDSRVTEVRRHERLLSVLCGKLDAVFEASDRILREIR
ncbi:FAD-dependent oxidoreductase [uncultured Georgenia sp.]|uniref:FAD-dependent oxidoreductase n=1 Tax=uncultured Georgenia sp. TaxID=378209 RepID=UPI00260483E0|nr:FAD-dependent oxidoreductase [uncultured Georgenia sp.]